MLKLDFVQAGRVGHIFKALRPAIAKQPNLAALFSFTDRGDVNPSVIVIIQSGQAKTANPIEFRKIHPLELASTKVAPQAEAGCNKMSEGQIHPAIFVEVESNDAGGRAGRFALPGIDGTKSAFARIEQHHRLRAG